MFFIHIGQRKTGTTSLQQFFAMNAQALEAAGVCYTELGRNESHRALAQAFVEPRPDVAHLLPKLRQLASANPRQRYLISSEIFERTDPEGITQIRELLQPHDVRILVYIRNFADQKVSFYNQRTKSGANVDDFDHFFEHEKFVSGGFEKLEQWSRVFGKENLRVVALDSLTGDNALIHDALAAMDISLDALPTVDQASLALRNVSYGWKVTELFRALSGSLWAEERLIRVNRREVKKRPHKRVLLSECERIASDLGFAGDRAAYLTRAQAAQLQSDYFNAIQRLNAFVDASISLGAPKEAEERPFLPSVERVPAGERTSFAQALAKTNLRQRLPGLEKALARLA